MSLDIQTANIAIKKAKADLDIVLDIFVNEVGSSHFDENDCDLHASVEQAQVRLSAAVDALLYATAHKRLMDAEIALNAAQWDRADRQNKL